MTPRAHTATSLSCREWISYKKKLGKETDVAAANLCDQSFQARVDITCNRLAKHGFDSVENIPQVTQAQWSQMSLPLTLLPIVQKNSTILGTAFSRPRHHPTPEPNSPHTRGA